MNMCELNMPSSVRKTHSFPQMEQSHKKGNLKKTGSILGSTQLPRFKGKIYVMKSPFKFYMAFCQMSEDFAQFIQARKMNMAP